MTTIPEEKSFSGIINASGDAANKNCNTENVSKEITQFLKESPKSKLRERGMILIKKYPTSSFAIEEALQRFEELLTENDKQWESEIYNGHVSFNIWKECFKIIVKQDVAKYSYVIDRLFHIRNFEDENREESAYFLIRRLFYDRKTFNNGIDWILIFKLKLTKFIECKFEAKDTASGKGKTMEASSHDNENSPWMKLVNDTAQEFHKIYSDGNFEELSPCIHNFYSNCKNEWLRGATMDLVFFTNSLLSKIENADPSLFIFQILMGLIFFLKEKDQENFRKEFSVKVSDNAVKRSLKVAINQRREKCFPALDLLYKITTPENGSEMIYEIIRELLGNQKTVINGFEKIQYFDLDLEKLKYSDNDNDVDDDVNDDQPCVTHIESLLDIIEKLDYDSKKSEIAIALFLNGDAANSTNYCISDRENKISVTPCPLKHLRAAVVEFLAKVDLTKETSSELVLKICKNFNGRKKLKVDVPDNLWSNAWEKCTKNPVLLNLISPDMFESIFRVNNPETTERQRIIYDTVSRMLSRSESFCAAILWFKKFQCLKKLREEQFEPVVAYSFLFRNKTKTSVSVFPNKEDKQLALKILENLLKSVRNNALPNFLEEHKNSFSGEELLRYIFSLAKKFNLDIAKTCPYAYDELFIQKVKDKYEFLDQPYFELYALEYLKVQQQDEKHKHLFVQSISADKCYAYCWAKFLEISEIPKKWKTFCTDDGITEFKKRLSEIVYHPVEGDKTEECKFWGRPYKLITITTVEGVERFAEKYMINEKPKVMGLDCESGKSNEVVTVQIATTEWACLIDIQALYDEVSEEEWCNNLIFLSNYFLILKLLLLDMPLRMNSNLFKLTNYMHDNNIAIKDFCAEKTVGLAKLTASLADVDMDKTEQVSNWNQRPLTQFQKIYAVTDAIIVVLLKDHMEESLKKEYSVEDVNEIMKNGYMCYEEKK